MNKRVYISLPITGRELEERRAYADKAAEKIREKSKGCRLEKATADIYDLEILFEE